MRAGWTDVLGVLAGIATTLLGLALVAFQVNRDWHRDALPRVIAMQTLAEFLVPVLVGHRALMPGNYWRFGAVAVGAAGLALVARHLAVLVRTPARLRTRSYVAQGRLYVLPVLAYGALITAGLAEAEPVLAFALLWLVLSGSVEAFVFVADRTPRVSPPRPNVLR